MTTAKTTVSYSGNIFSNDTKIDNLEKIVQNSHLKIKHMIKFLVALSGGMSADIVTESECYRKHQSKTEYKEQKKAEKAKKTKAKSFKAEDYVLSDQEVEDCKKKAHITPAQFLYLTSFVPQYNHSKLWDDGELLVPNKVKEYVGTDAIVDQTFLATVKREDIVVSNAREQYLAMERRFQTEYPNKPRNLFRNNITLLLKSNLMPICPGDGSSSARSLLTELGGKEDQKADWTKYSVIANDYYDFLVSCKDDMTNIESRIKSYWSDKVNLDKIKEEANADKPVRTLREFTGKTGKLDKMETQIIKIACGENVLRHGSDKDTKGDFNKILSDAKERIGNAAKKKQFGEEIDPDFRKFLLKELIGSNLYQSRYLDHWSILLKTAFGVLSGNFSNRINHMKDRTALHDMFRAATTQFEQLDVGLRKQIQDFKEDHRKNAGYETEYLLNSRQVSDLSHLENAYEEYLDGQEDKFLEDTVEKLGLRLDINLINIAFKWAKAQQNKPSFDNVQKFLGTYIKHDEIKAKLFDLRDDVLSTHNVSAAMEFSTLGNKSSMPKVTITPKNPPSCDPLQMSRSRNKTRRSDNTNAIDLTLSCLDPMTGNVSEHVIEVRARRFVHNILNKSTVVGKRNTKYNWLENGSPPEGVASHYHHITVCLPLWKNHKKNVRFCVALHTEKPDLLKLVDGAAYARDPGYAQFTFCVLDYSSTPKDGYCPLSPDIHVNARITGDLHNIPADFEDANKNFCETIRKQFNACPRKTVDAERQIHGKLLAFLKVCDPKNHGKALKHDIEYADKYFSSLSWVFLKLTSAAKKNIHVLEFLKNLWHKNLIYAFFGGQFAQLRRDEEGRTRLKDVPVHYDTYGTGGLNMIRIGALDNIKRGLSAIMKIVDNEIAQVSEQERSVILAKIGFHWARAARDHIMKKLSNIKKQRNKLLCSFDSLMRQFYGCTISVSENLKNMLCKKTNSREANRKLRDSYMRQLVEMIAENDEREGVWNTAVPAYYSSQKHLTEDGNQGQSSAPEFWRRHKTYTEETYAADETWIKKKIKRAINTKDKGVFEKRIASYVNFSGRESLDLKTNMIYDHIRETNTSGLGIIYVPDRTGDYFAASGEICVKLGLPECTDFGIQNLLTSSPGIRSADASAAFTLAGRGIRKLRAASARVMNTMTNET